tara:strand:+ start:3584 stop:5743 length:2160 start_codon:yes stop_codon:yes gene_type:complete
MATINKEYSLKVSTEQAQKNVDDLNKNLKIQEELLFDIEKEIRDYEKQLKKTSKTDLAARKAINDKIAKTKERLNDERFGLKELNKERKKANETLKESEENAADYGGVLGMVDQKTGGLISSIGGMTKSIGSATKGFNLMKIAIIGTGIGALLIALTSLSAAFTSSEEGQNTWNKIMAVLGATVSVFTDRLASLGRGLISLFTDPIETLKGFGNSIQEFVMDKIDLAVESLGFMGSAISKLFSGDFSGALDDAGKGIVGLNRALNPAVIITEALVNSTKDLITELSKEAKIAGQISDDRAKADKLDRQLIEDRAEANRKRAELLEKAVNKEKYSTLERIEFLKEAGRLEDEITKQEVAAAELRLKAKIAENALGDSTKEDLEEEATLKANLINLETARLMKQREVTGQVIAFTAEAASADLAKTNEEIANAKAVQDFKDSLRIKDKENKFAEIEAEKEARILALEDLKLSETEKQQMILDVEQAFKEKKKLIEEDEKVLLDEEKAAFLEAQLGQEELSLEKQRQMALDELTRFGATEDEKLAINTKYNKLETQQDKIKRDAEIDMAKNTFAGIANLLGENSKAGKAAAVAAALINTYQGITAELQTKTTTPWGFALKLVNIASTASIGFKAVKSIMATNPKSGGGGSATNPAAGRGTPTAESIPPIPPAFNIVGANSTNQLADAIGGQSQQPVQAFVVASEVTTAQSLERNTIESATLG